MTIRVYKSFAMGGNFLEEKALNYIDDIADFCYHLEKTSGYAEYDLVFLVNGYQNDQRVIEAPQWWGEWEYFTHIMNSIQIMGYTLNSKRYYDV